MSKCNQAASQNRNRCSIKKYIRFEHDLLKAIEAAKPESESFSAWVKIACWAAIPISPRPETAIRTISTPLSEFEPSLSLIAEMSHSGLFNQQIADELNRRGLLSPKGKCWTRAAVKEVLDE